MAKSILATLNLNVTSLPVYPDDQISLSVSNGQTAPYSSSFLSPLNAAGALSKTLLDKQFVESHQGWNQAVTLYHNLSPSTTYNRLQTSAKKTTTRNSNVTGTRSIQHKFSYDLIPLTVVMQTLHIPEKVDTGGISSPFRVQHTFDGNLIPIQEAQRQQQTRQEDSKDIDKSDFLSLNMSKRPRLLRTLCTHTPLKFVSVRRPSLVTAMDEYTAHRAIVQWMPSQHTALPSTSSVRIRLGHSEITSSNLNC